MEFNFLDYTGLSTFLKQLKNLFVKKEEIDNELNDTSLNPVQNKVIHTALEGKVSTTDVTTTVSDTEGSKIPTSQAVIDYVGSSGGGIGGIAKSIDVHVTLLSSDWTPERDKFVQTATVLQLRSGMTPMILLDDQYTDEQFYAYNLISDYTVENGKIKFYADSALSTDISIVIKGLPTQEIDYVDNTLLVEVPVSGFQKDEAIDRYVQTITVNGMKAGLGGTWDILRSGEVLTLEEAKIASTITDVIRLENAIKVVCTEIPSKTFTLVLHGTYKETVTGDVIVSGKTELQDKVARLETEITNVNKEVDLHTNKLSEIDGKITTVESDVESLNSKIGFSDIEFGSVELGVISEITPIKKSVKFKNAHKNIPQSISLTYSAYSYFYTEMHIEYGSMTSTGFDITCIPKEIGSGTGAQKVYWIAIWE